MESADVHPDEHPDVLVKISRDELNLIRGGLHDLADRIREWQKGEKVLFFRKDNPHKHHGTSRLSQIEDLILRLTLPKH